MPTQNELDELRITCAVRAEQSKTTGELVHKLDRAVFGNGKEGLMETVGRIDERLDSMEQKLDKIPNTIKEEVAEAVDKLTLQINTKKIQAITREEITKSRQQSVESPGSWGEFRKTWLIPVVMIVVTAIVQVGLSYIIIQRAIP